MVETESFFFYTEKRGGKMEITKEKFNLLIGRKIMELRKKQCYTREELAEYVDISPKYLYEIELGRKSCSLFIGYKLSKCLEVDLDYLLQEKMSPLEKKILIICIIIYRVIKKNRSAKFYKLSTI